MLKIFKKLRWFYPGIRVKRWISLSVLGIFFLIVGTVRFVQDSEVLLKSLDSVVIVIGAALLISGVRSLVQSFLSLLLPSSDRDKELLDIIYQKRYLEKGPRVVTIGGGHGLSSLLMGIRNYTKNIIAVVTVADSGGSSGRIREEFGILPPGDIRNCLVSLADSPTLMGDLFQYRFSKDSALKGHNFGNLLITAMTQLTGDFKKAIEETSKVLAVRGRVLPSTLEKVSLVAKFENGTATEGEAEIPKKEAKIRKVYLKSLEKNNDKKIKATVETIEAIKRAQIIVIGPGSLYTSILPNLVIEDIQQAIIESSALKVYICNVMTQHGETDNYTAFQHLQAILKHTHPRIVDYCLVNTRIPEESILKKYREENAVPVKVDTAAFDKTRCKLVKGDLIYTEDVVRHDPDKVSKIILELFRKEAIHKEI